MLSGPSSSSSPVGGRTSPFVVKSILEVREVGGAQFCWSMAMTGITLWFQVKQYSGGIIWSLNRIAEIHTSTTRNSVGISDLQII